jgi:hypothetical protein
LRQTFGGETVIAIHEQGFEVLQGTANRTLHRQCGFSSFWLTIDKQQTSRGYSTTLKTAVDAPTSR